MGGERDRIGKKARGWEYFEGFTEGLKVRANALVVREDEKVKKLINAGSWGEANSLVLKIEGEVAMAVKLGLITKRQAQRIHDQYFKDQTPV